MNVRSRTLVASAAVLTLMVQKYWWVAEICETAEKVSLAAITLGNIYAGPLVQVTILPLDFLIVASFFPSIFHKPHKPPQGPFELSTFYTGLCVKTVHINMQSN